MFTLTIWPPSSNTGLVNVYNAESTIDLEGGKPKTLKTIGNLTTSISTLRFNHDSQLLAIASNDKKDQMRMVRQYSIFPKLSFVHLHAIGPLPVIDSVWELAHVKYPSRTCNLCRFFP